MLRRSATMLRWIGIAALAFGLSRSSIASAGVCLDDEEIEGYVKELERHAKGGDEPQGYWSICVAPGDKLGPRVVKACTKIIEKPATSAARSECVPWLVESGVTSVGAVDLVAAMLAGKWDLYGEVTRDLRALAANGDPRVRGFVAGKLRDHLATVKAKPLRGWKANAWVKWQLAGLAALRKLGDASDVALLDELVAATKDKKVHKAAAKAKAEIAARAAKAP